MKVAVFGCGPAGLMAAHAASLSKAEVTIFSRGEPSPLYGAQYLHDSIPGTPSEMEPGTKVEYMLDGDVDGYRRKVYGRLWDGVVSPEDLVGEHWAWDIRATYRFLWEKYKHLITPVEVEPFMLGQAVDGNDVVFNSIPRDVLCVKDHSFGHTNIVAAGDAPALGIRLPFSCPNNQVICNGKDSPTWYRMSRVFGHTTVEWPGSIGRVPITTAATVKKPTKTNCDCWPGVKHIGRYGRWEKGVLSHTAFWDAWEAVK